MAGPLLKDAKWVRQSFLVRAEDLDPVDLQNRTFSTVSLKYTDTTPGGNFAINPPPQFTRYADLRSPGRFARNREGIKGARGMGRYYSEAIDDNAQIIHMRFGVAEFSSMTQFWSSFYNTGAGHLARTGRANNAFYYLGRAAGFIVSIMSWKVLAVHLLGHAARFISGFNNSSKFYYMKPTMSLYWNAVTTIINQLAVNRGIIPRAGGNPNAQKINGGQEGSPALIAQLNALLPDIFKKNGGIDVYAMATRAQRLARKHYALMEAAQASMREDLTADEISKRLAQAMGEGSPLTDSNRPNFNSEDGTPNPTAADQSSYLERWFKTTYSQPANKDDKSAGNEQAITPELADDNKFKQFFMSEWDDGGAFVSFRVNATGPTQESFSNTTTQSEIQNKVNSAVSSARSTKFSFGDGNVIGGAVGAAVGGIVDAVGSMARGALDQLNIGGLAVLGGAAFVDIPEHWQSSVASLPRASYTIELRSPYGNPISQLLNLYIPLAMLLAGALPLSTGRQSYTSPFLLELYDKGRCQTRLGMIDSLSISRGTGNLGFNSDGHALGIDVTFTVKDLSSIMHMPISQGFTMGTGAKIGAVVGGGAGAIIGSGLGPAGTIAGAAGGAVAGTAAGAAVDFAVEGWNGIFADDNAFNDYMSVISGMGLADQIYQFRKLYLNFTKTRAEWDSYWSVSRLASVARDTLPGTAISALFKGTVRDGPSLLAPGQQAVNAQKNMR